MGAVLGDLYRDPDLQAAGELSMALEEEFGVTIADEELPNMKTVGDLVKYLEDHAE